MKPTNDFLTLQSLVSDIEVISESEFRQIGFSKEYSLLYHEWFDDSEDIDEAIFMGESAELFEVLRKLRPRYFIPNDRKRKVSLSEDLNDYLVGNFQPIYAHPTMKKVALVNNERLSIQGQAENTMEEVKQSSSASGAEFMFFNDLHQAVKWLGL